MQPAVLLDRDGTIIVDTGFVASPADVALLEGAGEGLRALAALGYRLVVISNQSGVGRGMFDTDAVWAVDTEMRRQLAEFGVAIDGSYYCPHHPDDGCECRKPSPYMIRLAADELGLDLERSWMVGDRQTDLDAGRSAGCRTAACGFTSTDGSSPVIQSLVELAEVLHGSC